MSAPRISMGHLRGKSQRRPASRPSQVRGGSHLSRVGSRRRSALWWILAVRSSLASAEAFEALREATLNLLLSDVMMPATDGLELRVLSLGGQTM